MSINSSITRLRVDSPYRPADWRWQKACYLKNKKSLASKRKDDKWIAEALRFKIALDACKTQKDLEELTRTWYYMYLAYEIYDESDEGDIPKGRPHPTRYEIEARILAEESFASIGWKTHVAEGAIEIYEKLFFNVLDRIDSESYICNQIIGSEALQKGLGDRDYDKIWKLYGYHHGEGAVDELVTTFPQKRKKLARGEMESVWEEDKRATMNRKAALAARSMAVNNFTNLPIFDAQTKATEVANKSLSGVGGGGALSEDWLKLIGNILLNLPWVSGKKLEDAHIVAPFVDQGYDKDRGYPVEPRADQILMLAYKNGRLPKLAKAEFPDQPADLVDESQNEETDNGEVEQGS